MIASMDPLQALLQELSRELAVLTKSGENWQLLLHGGRSGDVKLEVKRTRELLPPKHRQAVQTVEDTA